MSVVYRCALGLAMATGLLGCGGSEHPRTTDPAGAGMGATAGASAGSGSSVPGGAGNHAAGGSNNAGGAGNGSNGGTGNGSAGSQSLPTGVAPSALIPQRVRRLTNAEFDASVSALTGSGKALGRNFSPDARQDDFTVNDAQRIDNVTAKQIYAAAQELAAEVKANVTTRAPCATAGGSDECAKTFIGAFGQRAFRRPLTSEEADGLFTVYQTGRSEATYADGIELVATAVLNSAGFLYLTELGNGPPAASSEAVALTPYELASALSYLVTAGPPSDQLVADALAGKLDTPEGRYEAFWNLITGSAVARDRVVRVLREWLGVDRLAQTDKDSTVYKDFNKLKAAMDAESVDFIVKVLTDDATMENNVVIGGSVRQLLYWESTFSDADLVTWYATKSGGVAAPKRNGILNQAAFLSVFAHASESAPVLRGVEIARRVGCLEVPSPTTLNIQVIPPAPDPRKTTRERFEVHATDVKCAGCHDTIDSFGFAFEEYDGMGAFRATDAGKPVNSNVTVSAGADFDGVYENGNQLALALSKSAQVRACFARHMFRASAARSDASVSASEEAFVKFWQALPAEKQGNILETLATFVKSPLFSHRRGS